MMQLGAHFAGIAIEQSMLGAAHACANPLTARVRPHPRRRARRSSFPTSSAGTGWSRSSGYAALLGSPRRRARDARGAGDARPAHRGLRRRRRPAGPAERCRGQRGGAARARRARGGAMDRHVQPAAVRCGGGAGDLSGGVLTLERDELPVVGATEQRETESRGTAISRSRESGPENARIGRSRPSRG